MKFFNVVSPEQNSFYGFYLMSKIKSAVRRGSFFSRSVNETCFEMNFIANYEFCRNILLASLDSSLADMKILSVKTTMVLKILEILPEVIFMMLLVMSISLPSQVIFWHGVQINLSEFGMRLIVVNV